MPRIVIDLPQAERLKLREMKSFHEHVNKWFEENRDHGHAYIRIDMDLVNLLDDARECVEEKAEL